MISLFSAFSAIQAVDEKTKPICHATPGEPDYPKGG
jgi:hypothetical protein